ncbi:hypothetical protein U0070_010157, partial [Myodes glareolus]
SLSKNLRAFRRNGKERSDDPSTSTQELGASSPLELGASSPLEVHAEPSSKCFESAKKSEAPVLPLPSSSSNTPNSKPCCMEKDMEWHECIKTLRAPRENMARSANVGKYRYINVVLQALCSVPLFVNELFNQGFPWIRPPRDDFNMRLMQLLLVAWWFSGKSRVVLSPSAFLKDERLSCLSNPVLIFFLKQKSLNIGAKRCMHNKSMAVHKFGRTTQGYYYSPKRYSFSESRVVRRMSNTSLFPKFKAVFINEMKNTKPPQPLSQNAHVKDFDLLKPLQELGFDFSRFPNCRHQLKQGVRSTKCRKVSHVWSGQVQQEAQGKGATQNVIGSELTNKTEKPKKHEKTCTFSELDSGSFSKATKDNDLRIPERYQSTNRSRNVMKREVDKQTSQEAVTQSHPKPSSQKQMEDKAKRQGGTPTVDPKEDNITGSLIYQPYWGTVPMKAHYINDALTSGRRIGSLIVIHRGATEYQRYQISSDSSTDIVVTSNMTAYLPCH